MELMNGSSELFKLCKLYKYLSFPSPFIVSSKIMISFTSKSTKMNPNITNDWPLNWFAMKKEINSPIFDHDEDTITRTEFHSQASP